MNKENLSDAIGRLDDDLVEEALASRTGRPHRWHRVVAAVASVCVLVGGLLALPFTFREGQVTSCPPPPDEGVEPSWGTTTQAGQDEPDPGEPDETVQKIFLTAEPTLPAMAQRPAEYEETAHAAWWDGVKAQRDQIKGYTEGMTDFYSRTMQTFLAGEPGENRVYSPLNLYLALSMLAETANGNSRTQLLDLLGESNLTALRKKNSGLWNGVYLDDGAVTSRLANSLWLAEGDRWSYRKDTVEVLAKKYYASVFEGVMGDALYSKALQDWLNKQTNGLLEEQAGNLKFDPDTVLALASTICFQAKWTDEFSTHATQKGWFHTSYGKDVNCDFMRRGNMTFAYFGDKFTAVRLGLDDGAYAMTIFLPEEGTAVDSLLGVKNAQVLEILQKPDRSELGKYMQVEMKIPKFDVVSDRDLKDGLRALGVTDVFDAKKGDFTGILSPQDEPVFVNQVQHAARVAIDEEGVTAVAYTVEIMNGAGAASDILDFTVDRPFMFAITGPGDTILFTGIVETPTEA